MQCWVCGLAAQGVCRFCGRAICKDDAKTLPFVLEVYPSRGQLVGLALEDALYCGICQPKPEPIPMEFLERGGPADVTNNT
jgi:hypothetical protein